MRNYITLNLLKVKQHKSMNIYSSTIKFSNLLDTTRMLSRKTSDESYQRDLNKDRLKNIVKHINKCINIDTNYDMAVFSTPLVLSIDTQQEITDDANILYENSKDFKEVDSFYEKYIHDYFEALEKKENLSQGEKENLDNKPKSIVVQSKDFDRVYIPLVKDSIFIVDGQHRFEGLKRYCEDTGDTYTKNNFEFMATILVDYDLYQQSRVFADINFNQKSVNKSLYYDIFGSIYNTKDEITFSHYLVKHLNDTEEFNNIVKMLGSGSGIISLAFMVETIKDNLLDKCMRDLYLTYENDTSIEYKKILAFLKKYFLYIKNNFNDYFPEKSKKRTELKGDKYKLKKFEYLEKEKDKTYIVSNYFSSRDYKFYLFKTTGMYSLLLILNDIIKSNEVFDYNEEKLNNYLDKVFKKIKEDEKKYFDNDDFKNTAGKGSQNKFYKLLSENLNISK